MITSIENYKSKQKFSANFIRTAASQGNRYTTQIVFTSGYPDGRIADKSLVTDFSIPDNANGLYVSRMRIANDSNILMFNINLFDILAYYGTYNFGVDYTLVNPITIPSSRLPDNSYVGTELWFLCNATMTTVGTYDYTYINQDGVLKSMSYNMGYGPITRTAQRLPLADNDTGIQKLVSIKNTGSTSGNFYVFIARFICANTFKSRTKSVENSTILDSEVSWIPDNAFLMTMNIQNVAQWTTLINLELLYA